MFHGSGVFPAVLLPLIGLDHREIRELLDFVREHPETAAGVERALVFRVRVEHELDNLTSAPRTLLVQQLDSELEALVNEAPFGHKQSCRRTGRALKSVLRGVLLSDQDYDL